MLTIIGGARMLTLFELLELQLTQTEQGQMTLVHCSRLPFIVSL